MRHFRSLALLAALLLAACGVEQAAAPAAGPAAPSTIAAATAAVAAATERPTVAVSAAPTAPPAAPTAQPAPTATPPMPTAQLILPPTTQPAAAPDTSATKPPVAQPAAKPAAPPRAQASASSPVRIVIKAIDMDQKIVSVGLDKHRVPIVPDHNVGWYNLSAMPGQGENVVLWGHVLRFRNAPKIPAPFARLKELQPGAAVVLYDKRGNAHNYVVKRQVKVTPDQVEYILPQGSELVTMVSCIGDRVIVDGEVVDESHRLITIAAPAD